MKGFVHLLLPIIILVIIVIAAGAFILGGKLSNKSIQITDNASQNSNIAPPNGKGQFNNPLQNHDTYITFSKDGKTWSAGSLVKKGASVPEIIQLNHDVGTFKSGDLLIYFVDASTLTTPGTEGIGIYHSGDLGKNWDSAGHIAISNKQNKGGAVDPSIVQLSDGSLRLYLFGSETTSGDPGQATGPHKVYSATSVDGVNFTGESGLRFQDNGLTDPDVIQFNGTWYMYYSDGSSTKLATSSDGLSFNSANITGGSVGGVPGAVAADSGVYLFGCSQGISEATSTNGINFTIYKKDIIPTQGAICDPSPIKLSDGTYAMAYKIQEGGNNGGNMAPQQQPPPQN